MEVRNCPRCGKVFQYMSSPVCSNCEKAEEETFQKLKEYINENPHCSLQELATATDVAPKRIMTFIRDGRLEISQGMSGEIRCDSCGRPISRGRYCDACVIKINQTVGEMFASDAVDKERTGPKMHINVKKRL